MCIANTIKKSLEQKKVDLSLTKEVAERFAEIQEAIKFLEGEVAPLKAKLIENGETILLPELEKKVLFLEGSEISQIDASSLGKKLLSEGREEDFLSVVSVTETSLKNLKDYSSLIADFKVSTGKKKADTISLREMTKKEITESKI